MRVAIIHYWLVDYRGGEKVVEQLLELYPNADVYTHVYGGAMRKRLSGNYNVQTTWVNRLPWAPKFYKFYLLLMPWALEALDLSEYDLVISSESGPAKGVIVSPDALHICYCHSPMRYLWDQRELYLNNMNLITRLIFKYFSTFLRIWDVSSSHRVDVFVANSRLVASRLERYYRRTGSVIHPPVDVERFEVSSQPPCGKNYYALVGQLVPYKNVITAVEAFQKSGKELVVVGKGELSGKVRALADATHNVTFLGEVSDERLPGVLAGAKALVFPGIEDFGIVPLEAMACGTPVVALAKGGALETVVNGVTGWFFDGDCADSINKGIDAFEKDSVYTNPTTPSACRQRAEVFSNERFRSEIRDKIYAELSVRNS